MRYISWTHNRMLFLHCEKNTFDISQCENNWLWKYHLLLEIKHAFSCLLQNNPSVSKSFYWGFSTSNNISTPGGYSAIPTRTSTSNSCMPWFSISNNISPPQKVIPQQTQKCLLYFSIFSSLIEHMHVPFITPLQHPTSHSLITPFWNASVFFIRYTSRMFRLDANDTN